MKNQFFILLTLIFFSCENEIYINDEWQDIPVIYAIFNSGTDEDADGSNFLEINPSFDFNLDGDADPDLNYLHFVRIQKSFLGSESAYNYTNISDSIYYNGENLDVWIELIDPSYTGNSPNATTNLIRVNDIELEALGFSKEDGLFSSENHYLYRLPDINDIGSFENIVDMTDLTQGGDCDHIYKIYVVNQLTGDTAFVETNIVEPLDIFKPASQGPLSILSLGGEAAIDLEIFPSKNAKMYSFSFRFHYLEQHRDDYFYDKNNGNPLPTTGVDTLYVDWFLDDFVVTDPDQLNGTSTNRISKKFYGAEFLTFLKSKIPEQDESEPEFYRYPVNSFVISSGANESGSGGSGYVGAGIYHRCVDLNITAINSELYTYMNSTAPNYGLNQERPEYNNISNGIGHFSSRSVLEMKNLRINQQAADALSFGDITKKLNFACYSDAASPYLINFGYACE